MSFLVVYSHIVTYEPTNLQTYKPTNSQTYKLTNLQTHKLTNSQTYKPTNSQTLIHHKISHFNIAYRYYLLFFCYISLLFKERVSGNADF